MITICTVSKKVNIYSYDLQLFDVLRFKRDSRTLFGKDYFPTVPRKDAGGQVVDLNTSTKCNTPGSYELPYAL